MTATAKSTLTAALASPLARAIDRALDRSFERSRAEPADDALADEAPAMLDLTAEPSRPHDRDVREILARPAVKAFLTSAEGQQLASRLHEHVREVIDTGRLLGLEEFVDCLLANARVEERYQLDAMDLSSAMLTRSMELHAQPHERWMGTDVPYGISEDDARAARFDPACPFCVADRNARRAAAAAAPPDGDGGCGTDDHACPLCDDLAADWRREHAAAIARYHRT